MKRIVAADLFCGAGGTSTGLARACDRLGVGLDLTAVNHWPIAVETHAANHPAARHLCNDLDEVNPRKAIGRRLDLLMASPECTHHSIARGGTPVNDQSRSTAWHVVRWAEALRPKAILVENVREFAQWGPIGTNGRPVKRLRGETFRAWINAIASLGYTVGYQILNAADYGDPTTRQRLFVLAILKSRQLPWPKQTHSRDGNNGLFGQLHRWRTAREIIDWSIPGKSIFNRKRPLSENTMRRIEAGIKKFGWPEPFLVLLRGTKAEQLRYTARSVDTPMPVVTAASEHIGLAQPFIVPSNFGERPGQRPRTHSIDDPHPTVVAGGVGHGVVEPFVMRASNTSSHRDGRNTSIDEPVGTIHANGGSFGVVEPFVMHITHVGGDRCKSTDEPLPTVTGAHRGELAFILPHRQFEQMDTDSIDRPLRTVTAQNGGCNGLVEPFLVPYYGTAEGADSIHEPTRAVTTKDRLGIVEPANIDIRFRMLQPHELAAAQGFPKGYKFAGNRSEQVKQIGNAVPVNIAEALTHGVLSA